MPDLTVAEVAKELSASPETIRRLIQSGDLQAYRLSGTAGPWRIEVAELHAYRERQRNRDPWMRTRPRRD